MVKSYPTPVNLDLGDDGCGDGSDDRGDCGDGRDIVRDYDSRSMLKKHVASLC
jgi:hypothetical protein